MRQCSARQWQHVLPAVFVVNALIAVSGSKLAASLEIADVADDKRQLLPLKVQQPTQIV